MSSRRKGVSGEGGGEREGVELDSGDNCGVELRSRG